MAADIHLQLDDIKGESADDKHKDEIEVLGWTWGVTQSESSHVGAAERAGRAAFSNLSFTHNVDRASPVLMKMCATGRHLREGRLTQRKAGAAPLDFLVIKFSDVQIASVSLSGAGESSIENVTLRFAKFEYEYKFQKPDGSFDAGPTLKFDISANREG